MIKKHSRCFIAMDTIIRIVLYAQQAPLGYIVDRESETAAERFPGYGERSIREPEPDWKEKRSAEQLLDVGEREIRRLEKLWSRFLQESDVSRLNRKAGANEAAVSPETIDLLESAISLSKKTEGAFDITTAPLSNLYGFGPGRACTRVIYHVSNFFAKENVDYSSLVLYPARNTAFIKRKGMSIDLGGIGKGAAADVVMGRLLECIENNGPNGISGVMLDMGGNILVRGNNGEHPVWRIGVRSPWGGPSSFCGALRIAQGAVSTSGVYERRRIRGKKPIHHIMDPRTRRPAQNGLLSVTVTFPEATMADGLSTAAFILGIERGSALIESYGSAGGVFITENGDFHCAGSANKQFDST